MPYLSAAAPPAAGPAAPAPVPRPERTAATPPARGRLHGVDLARWLAVAGMLAIHFGVPFLDPESPTAGLVSTYAWGRSTILFAFLAGISLALVSGGAEPHRGAAGTTAALRTAVRGGCLIAVGWGLNLAVLAADSNLTVIITFYGLYFLLAIPFLRLSAGWAAAAAAALLLTGPQLLWLLRRSADIGGTMAHLRPAVDRFDPGHLLAEQGLMELGVFGYYPALAYMAAVLAGLAVGRLDLRSPAVRLKIALGGVLLAFLAYRTSWHAWYSYGLFGELGAREEVADAVPTHDARWLLTSMPHTATTPELLGGIGVAMAVLAGCLWCAERFPRTVAPFTAAGAMALTVYALHALVMAWQAWLPEGTGGLPGLLDASMAEVYLVGSAAAALLWRTLIGRGPLEAGVSEVAKAAVPGRRSPAHARRR
ncbi:heparan-alpha-glucosaminide N-acetyltransferase domain-containing protein [Nocardiopsis coralliicola]